MMPSGPTAPALFAIWRELIEQHCGLHYAQSDRELLLDKLRLRADLAGFDSLLDYYYYLRYDPGAGPEMHALVESLAVGETYFFRELEQLRFVATQFVPPLVAAGARPRIWSAACSTGEEPLTVAMLLAQQGLLDKVELVASDVSQSALQRAQEGRFGRRALRDVTDPELARRYVIPTPDGFTVPRELREAVRWLRINLTNPAEVAKVGPCDVILLRNVLIYFRDETIVRVVDDLTRALKPGGALFVGVSESLLRHGTSLAFEERQKVFFYRKQP